MSSALSLALDTLDDQKLEQCLSLVRRELETRRRISPKAPAKSPLTITKCMPLVRFTARIQSNKTGVMPGRKVLEDAAGYLAERLVDNEETQTY